MRLRKITPPPLNFRIGSYSKGKETINILASKPWARFFQQTFQSIREFEGIQSIIMQEMGESSKDPNITRRIDAIEILLQTINDNKDTNIEKRLKDLETLLFSEPNQRDFSMDIEGAQILSYMEL